MAVSTPVATGPDSQQREMIEVSQKYLHACGGEPLEALMINHGPMRLDEARTCVLPAVHR